MVEPQTTQEIRALVIARDKRTCQYCGKSKLSGVQMNLDHVCPTSKGGHNTPQNLVVACRQCNFRKGKKPAEQYIADRLESLEREQKQLRATLDRLQGSTNNS